MLFHGRNGVTNQATYMYPERGWATPFSTEYHDGEQEPEVVIT